MSFRSWLSIVTFLLLVVVIFLGWNEIIKAWELLDTVNIWIWALLIPVQLASYYAVGSMIFSYLKSKGEMRDISHWRMTRIALELNFVNHILPSGGAAGFSYLGWILHKYGIGAGRATIAQIVRFILTFLSLIAIIFVSIGYLAIDGRVDRTIVTVSGSLGLVVIATSAIVMYLIGSKKRLQALSCWLSTDLNAFIEKVSFKRFKNVINKEHTDNFFDEIHQDYLAIRRDMRILRSPLLWAFSVNILDMMLIFLAFLSLGFFINPAVLFIAYGVSSLMSIFAATPGGTGVYEAIMIAFLASSGMSPDVAIAGTLLARVTLLVGTIVFGYLFYQLTISKYGVNESK